MEPDKKVGIDINGSRTHLRRSLEKNNKGLIVSKLMEEKKEGEEGISAI